MSVREYIGARYVPLFADPIDWDSTKTYEPLTVVYNQGNSYTSRQYVPAGIDISNDTYWARTGNYNAQIEQYRSEVATFDGRITTNETNITDLQNATVGTEKLDDNAVTTAKIKNANVTTDKLADNAVTTDKLADNAVTTAKILDANVTTDKLADNAVTTAKILDANVTTVKLADNSVTTAKINDANVTTDKLANNAVTIDKLSAYYTDFNNIVLIGDSYGEGYTPTGTIDSWITRFKNEHESGYNFFSDAAGGTGFVNKSNGFLASLNKLISSMTEYDRKKTSKILVAGGFNDRGNTEAAIYNGMEAFANAARLAYPNAKIYVAFVGNIVQGLTTGIHSTATYASLASADQFYYRACIRLGINYVIGARNVLQDNKWFSSDYVHPNADGQFALFYFLANAIYYGTGKYYNNYSKFLASVNTDLFSAPDTFEVWSVNYLDQFVPYVHIGKNNATMLTLKNKTNIRGNDEIKIGTINAACITGTQHYNGGFAVVNFENNSSTDYYLTVPCILNVYPSGDIYLRFLYADTNGDWYTFNKIKKIGFIDTTSLNIYN